MSQAAELKYSLVHIFKVIGKIYFSGEWKTWYTWLKPFFPSMKMLPYTFLALLTADQLVNLLEKADDDAIRGLPLDGVLACTLYHLKSSKVCQFYQNTHANFLPYKFLSILV